MNGEAGAAAYDWIWMGGGRELLYRAVVNRKTGHIVAKFHSGGQERAEECARQWNRRTADERSG